MRTHGRRVAAGRRVFRLAGRTLLPFLTCCALAVAAVPVAAGAQAAAEAPDHVGGLVAISTFANVTQDPADDWLGEGIAETVATDFDAAGLTVVGPGASGPDSAGAGPDASPAGILSLGRALGARWVVTGGYQRLGERLRITARLVDVGTGAVRRAVRADGATGELFALQDRIAAGLLTDGDPAGASGRVALAERPAATFPEPEPRPLGGAAAGGRRVAEGELVAELAPEPPATGETRAGMEPGPLVMPGTAGRIAPAPEAPALESEPGRPRRGAPPGVAARPPTGGAAGPPSAAAAMRPPTGGVGGFGVASSAGILTGRPSVRPARTNTPPRIDGRLDDAVWRDATVITDFVQQTPLDGAPATEQTEVYLAYDTQNIYLGVYAHYSNPADIRANRSDRDQTFADDTLTVYFDPFLDQQRAYVFSVNGYGVQGDAVLDSQSRGF
ncbi:MAG: hypothetical protein OXH04_15810, partial [Acidobacteria bacterium]|nr:hypothetical protein [Acidobacteriota bacterium]